MAVSAILEQATSRSSWNIEGARGAAPKRSALVSELPFVVPSYAWWEGLSTDWPEVIRCFRAGMGSERRN